MKQVPKTLLIGPALRNGGAEKRFWNLCRKLFDGKADVCVLHDDRFSDSAQRIISLGWKRTLNYPHVILKLNYILRNEKYDIAIGFGLYPNLVLWLASRILKNRPMIILSEITRPWAAYQTDKSNIKLGCVQLLMKIAYPSADMFIANSIDGIAESVSHYGVREHLTKRIPNIIDQKEITKKSEESMPLGNTLKHHTIVMVSRLIRMKRIDTALEAMALLPRNIDCTLMIVGEGSELLSLKQLTNDLGIADRVFFSGWLENPLGLVRQASMYVMTSEYEGFSNSVLEAMFLDVPVITSYCSTDARHMCQQGAALGFETGDAKMLAQHFITLMISKQERDRLIDRARYYRSWHESTTAISYYEKTILKLYENSKNI